MLKWNTICRAVLFNCTLFEEFPIIASVKKTFKFEMFSRKSPERKKSTTSWFSFQTVISVTSINISNIIDTAPVFHQEQWVTVHYLLLIMKQFNWTGPEYEGNKEKKYAVQMHSTASRIGETLRQTREIPRLCPFLSLPESPEVLLGEKCQVKLNIHLEAPFVYPVYTLLTGTVQLLIAVCTMFAMLEVAVLPTPQ